MKPAAASGLACCEVVNEPRLHDVDPSRVEAEAAGTVEAGTHAPASGPTHWERAVGFGVVALCVCVVVGIMNPGMRFLPLNRIHFGESIFIF